jgi:hypothetical protein
MLAHSYRWLVTHQWHRIIFLTHADFMLGHATTDVTSILNYRSVGRHLVLSIRSLHPRIVQRTGRYEAIDQSTCHSHERDHEYRRPASGYRRNQAEAAD